MKVIIKQVIKSYLRSPIFWLGMVIVTIGIFQNLSSYLGIHYLSSEQETSKLKAVPTNDWDISNYYVPSSKEQQWAIWKKFIIDTLVLEFEMEEEEAQSIMNPLRRMEIEDACNYLEKKYGYNGAIYSYEDAAYHLGTMEEVNTYLDNKLEKHSFSFYFSRKFADFAGLYMVFFAMVLLAVLFIQDTRKSTYELLHTKPISAGKYVLGKVTGGFSICCIALGLLNIIFYIACLISTNENGFQVYFRDFLSATIIYILPNMLMIVCVYALVALLFKNPLPAAPLLFLYAVYSNIGSRNAEGIYVYNGKPLAIMVRFPGLFFDTSPPPLVYLNQCFLIIASIVIIVISIQLWKRRRT